MISFSEHQHQIERFQIHGDSESEVGLAQFLSKLAQLQPFGSPPWALRGPGAGVNGRGGGRGAKAGGRCCVCEVGKLFSIAPCKQYTLLFVCKGMCNKPYMF